MTPPVVLLAALEAFLREDLGRERGPYETYQARIAVNLLALLRRERDRQRRYRKASATLATA